MRTNDNTPPPSASDISYFPKESAAPEVGRPPTNQKDLINWADKEDLCATAWNLICSAERRYEEQEERVEFVKRSKSSDNKYRVSQVTNPEKDDDGAEQVSDLSEAGYFTRINTFVTQVMNVLFGVGDLPAKYVPISEMADQDIEVSVRDVVDKRNLWEEYVFSKDKRKQKFREAATWCSVDANIPVKMVWAKEEKKVSFKKVKEWFDQEFDELGQPQPRRPKSFKRESKTIRKGWPSLRILDNKNFLADTQIPELCNQRLIIEKDQVALEDVWALQKQGYYMNAGKANRNMLVGESSDSETIERDRQENAGENVTRRINGLLAYRQVWAKWPINDKGEWDEENTLARWIVAEFLGNIGGDHVCLALRPNPHNCGELPYFMAATHPDRKGLYHMGFQELGNDLYNAVKTNVDQAFDNTTRITRGMYFTDGRLSTQDLRFRSGRLIKGSRGTALTPLRVERTTDVTINLAKYLEEKWDKTFFITPSLQGEVFGQRTPALESGNARADAQKLILNIIEHFSEPLLFFMLFWDMEMTDQYADTDDVATITKSNGLIQEIKPAHLWGDAQIAITAITEFEDNILRRRELNGFLPFMDQFGLDQEGKTVLGRVYAKEFRIPDREKIFHGRQDSDSKAVADEENRMMLRPDSPLDEGEYVAPKETENIDVHLESHGSAARVYSLLPKEQRNPENERLLQIHITETRRLQEQKLQGGGQAAGGGGQAPAAQAPENAPTGMGEMAQQELGAIEGGAQ